VIFLFSGIRIEEIFSENIFLGKYLPSRGVSLDNNRRRRRRRVPIGAAA